MESDPFAKAAKGASACRTADPSVRTKVLSRDDNSDGEAGGWLSLTEDRLLATIESCAHDGSRSLRRFKKMPFHTEFARTSDIVGAIVKEKCAARRTAESVEASTIDGGIGL